jgi:hypothetical protein
MPKAENGTYSLRFHKLRNVTDRLPDALASTVAKRMRAAYRNPDPLVAQADLEALARELDRSHPGAAASLREGLAETLTIGRLGVPPTPARTRRSTNSIESMIQICRDHAANVKRWQDGQMVLRWIAAGMGEARKQFRRVNGHLHLPALRDARDATINAVTPTKEDAAWSPLGPPPKSHGTRDNLAQRVGLVALVQAAYVSGSSTRSTNVTATLKREKHARRLRPPSEQGDVLPAAELPRRTRRHRS